MSSLIRTRAVWVLLALVVVSRSTPWGVAQEPSPNIVLIVADDLGYGDLGCYGSSRHQTPHIDDLAERGLRFTDFHSAGSMCTPTRAAMLSGRYQQRLGAMFEGPLSGKSDYHRGLPRDTVTVAELLQAREYVTGCFGKWHLGYEPPWLPLSHGFDRFVGLGSGDGDHHSHVDRWGRADWWHQNQRVAETGYTAELLTKHCLDFIREHRERKFFAYLPHLAIHFPWQGPSDPPHRQLGQSYEHDKWGLIPDPGNVRPHIKAMVEAVDRSVGQVVDLLKQLDLQDRTIVLFTSDNGGYLSYGERFRNISSNGPLRGQKGTLFEGGHRVPMIVYWPGRIRSGVSEQTAHSVDLLPTLVSLAGGQSKHWQSDGVDLRELLLNGAPLPPRQLFWRDGSEKAVRQGRWKLYVSGSHVALYDLEVDLGESHDLSAQRPELVAALQRAIRLWEADVAAKN